VRTPVVTTRESIEFDSGGVTLRGELRRPEGAGPFPAIILTHGLAFVIAFFEHHNFPRLFAEQGFVTLAYDHPNTGLSDGLPRQELDPVAQQRAYSDAITYLVTRNDVDPDRIGIWGTSYSGGHVLAVAAADPRVRCVVAQTPTIDGRRNLQHRLSPTQLAEQQQAWSQDRVDRARGLPLMTRPAGPPAAEEFVSSLPTLSRSGYRPFVTQRSHEWYFSNAPGTAMPYISPTPLLVIVAIEDQVTPAADARHAFDQALEPKLLLELPGGHFDVYGHLYEQCAASASDWFDQHLGDPSAA
jgi:fermentation-respiration switch protein FrsA (DUF1100 family)